MHLTFFKRACVGIVFCMSAVAALPAQTLDTIAVFDNSDGSYPHGPLLLASDGNFWGITAEGGTNQNAGTVFKVSPDGILTGVYSFCAQAGCTDGIDPTGIVQGLDGNFYGVTALGGVSGYGTFFRITPDGTLTTLHSFCTQNGCPDGYNESGLVQGLDGNFYGVTDGGGANALGTVYKITPQGALTTLYSFCAQANCADGRILQSKLLIGADGSIYGTTVEGGAYGRGTVYRLTPDGNFSSLYSFCAQTMCADGEFPGTGLMQASDGNLYGTTSFGGTAGNLCNSCGTVFRITPGGNLITLHSFNGTDGYGPNVELVQGTDGNLYGTTVQGGPGDNGTIFRISLEGAQSTLYAFCPQGTNCSDGAAPLSPVVLGTDGNLYGTTAIGGFGSVYRLSIATPGPATTTSLVSSAGTAYVGQPVTFTAMISGSSSTSPTGTVTFTISGNKPVTVPLTNGQASFPWTFAYAGSRTVTAMYSGSAFYEPSSAAPLSLTVDPTVVTIAGSPQQPLVQDGQGNYIAMVTITNTGNVTVSSLQVTIAGTTLGSGSLPSPPVPSTMIAPGASAVVTLSFPPNSVPSGNTTAPLKVSGTYTVSSPSISGNWTLSFRSVSF